MIKKVIGHWNVLRRSLLHIIICYIFWLGSWGFKNPEGRTQIFDIVCAFGGVVVYAVFFLLTCYIIGNKKKQRGMKKAKFTFVNTYAFQLDIAHAVIPISFCIFYFYRNFEMMMEYKVVMIICIWIFIALLFYYDIGSAVFPYQYYKKIQLMAARKNPELRDAWFSISDSQYDMSSFSLLPYIAVISDTIREECPIVFSQKDIEWINKKRKVNLSYLDFNKCLFYLEGNQKNENITDWMKKLEKFPHIKCVILTEGEKVWEIYQTEINDLKRCSPVEIIPVKEPIYDMFTLSRYIGKINPGFNARNMDINRKIISNPFLKERYLEISQSPETVKLLLSKVFNELEPLSGIYALFDLMDLMLRLALAFYAPQETEWYINSSNSKKIGNMFAMMTLLEQQNAFFLGKKLPKEQQVYCAYAGERKVYVRAVLTEKDEILIKKYLADYEVSGYEMNYADIIYLCARLRNAIRGHGTVAEDDMKNMMILLFKLVLVLHYVLELEKMFFLCETYGNWIYGSYGAEMDDRLVDFEFYRQEEIDSRKYNKKKIGFLLFIDGQMEFFNNYLKNTGGNIAEKYIEYINYQSGTLMTLSYKN